MGSAAVVSTSFWVAVTSCEVVGASSEEIFVGSDSVDACLYTSESLYACEAYDSYVLCTDIGSLTSIVYAAADDGRPYDGYMVESSVGSCVRAVIYPLARAEYVMP